MKIDLDTRQYFRDLVQRYYDSWVDEMSSDACEWMDGVIDILEGKDVEFGGCEANGLVWCESCNAAVEAELDLEGIVHEYDAHRAIKSANNVLQALKDKF